MTRVLEKWGEATPGCRGCSGFEGRGGEAASTRGAVKGDAEARGRLREERQMAGLLGDGTSQQRANSHAGDRVADAMSPPGKERRFEGTWRLLVFTGTRSVHLEHQEGRQITRVRVLAGGCGRANSLVVDEFSQ